MRLIEFLHATDEEILDESILDALPPGARKLATGLAMMAAISGAHGHESELEHPSIHPTINRAAVFSDRLSVMADIIGAENPDRYGQWVSNLYDVYQNNPEKFKRMFGVEYEKFMTAARMMTPQEMAQYMKDVAQSHGGITESMLIEAKCGIYNTLKRFRPDLAAEMEKVPGNSMNDSILFLQDNGLWDDTAHEFAKTIKQSRRQLNTTFPPQGKEANAARHAKYREAWDKALSDLMCHVVGLIKASAT